MNLEGNPSDPSDTSQDVKPSGGLYIGISKDCLFVSLDLMLN